MIKREKRVTALSLSVMLMLNMTATAVPVSAATGESKIYTHDGYTVEYTIKNEWTGNQNIEVTITNTGDDVLSGWAMGYNAFGEIGGLWNAKIYGHQGTEYILSSAGYNDELAPGQSTNFGYTLTGDKFKIPQNIVNCAERVDITEGYNVYYNITGDYGDTYQAEMVIENLSDTDINAWQLNFDGNASIDNLWNGKLLENNSGSFKVKNAENNSVIAAGGSASFNFSGRKLAEEAGSDVIETSAPATEPAAETTVVTDVSETDIAVGESETESISESEFVTERETVTEPATVIEQESETKTEVVFSNFKLTGIVIPMEFDFEIDPEIDSDEDGLPDYLEKEIGTDRYNADTDGDGLPDGYEYFTLGTDPKKADSDDNGISDADEDFDEDRLTNLEEYELGTDPFSKDTDYDGLSDYDEVKIHNTDPLKYDTDGDKVSDGDEIELGLDPNNPATNGYPDNEYTTKQTVGEDSSALDYINTIEDNPYTVSVEITAAGVAENNLSAGESGYSYSILQNDAVLGVVPELSYSDGLSVTDVVIKFKLDTNAAETSIDKLMVFKYFEDTNMLLPIETTYDASTNVISTHVDEVGTYCLINVEKWLGILEETPAGNYYEGGENEPANIVFCLDTRSVIDAESFNAVKNDIKTITENAFDRYSDIKVYVYYQQFGSNFKAANKLLTDSNGNNCFTGYEEAVAALDKLETYMIKNNYWAYDFVEATQFMIDNCDEKIIAMYHITADDRVMGGINKAKKLTQTVRNSKYTTADGEKIQRIYVSTLCPNDTEPFDTSSYAYELAALSKGIAVTGYVTIEDNAVMTAEVESVKVYASNTDETKTSSNVKKNLTDILGEGNNATYPVITSNGLVSVKLRKMLKRDSLTDTDEDGISDWNEVNVEIIEEIGSLNSNTETLRYDDLPTLGACLDMFSKCGYVYVEEGFNQLMSNESMHTVLNYPILPIISNPVDSDSDCDGIPDFCDEDRLKESNVYSNNKTSIFMILDKLCNNKGNGNHPTMKNSSAIYSLPNDKTAKINSINSGNYVELIAIVKNNQGVLWGKIRLHTGLCGYVPINSINYTYVESESIKYTPSDIPCNYKNTPIIPGQIYGNKYVLSNKVNSNSQKFTLFLSSEQIDNDNKLYNELITNSLMLDGDDGQYCMIYNGRRINIYEALADLESTWYSNDYNPFSYGQCTWYAYGRLAEVCNLQLNFNVNSDRDGGKWLAISNNSNEIKNNIITDNQHEIILECNYYNIKSKSLVSYMYNDDGHVMFIEAVKRDPMTGEPISVIFSDSWSGRSNIGVLIEMDMNTLIKEYGTAKKTNNCLYPSMNNQNINFQGYIQFE